MSTSLLLHMNDNLTDNSGQSHVATGTDITYAAGKFSTNAAVFNGTTSKIEYSAHADFNFGTSADFTIDFWMYATAIPASLEFIIEAPGSPGWVIYCWKSAGNLSLDTSVSGVWNINFTSNLSLNTWHHVAVVRSSGTIKAYLDGVYKGQRTSATDWNACTSLGLSTSYYYSGRVEEVRILKGEAAWTTDFAPPTSEYSGVTNAISIAGNSGVTFNTPLSITCTNSVITALPIISGNSFYNDTANWNTVTFIYKNGLAKKSFVFRSINSFGQITDRVTKLGAWTLYSIMINDINEGTYYILGSDLPASQNFTVVS